MIESEKKEWKELCDYVKLNILEYDNNMKFPTFLAIRLKGLKEGKFICNNSTQQQASYDYKTILYTFMLCKNTIVAYLHNNQTKFQDDENYKINFIMKVIEKEINDVYLRLKNKKESINKIENKDMSNQINESAEYITKSKTVNEKLKKIW
jgi:hypothetical protein